MRATSDDHPEPREAQFKHRVQIQLSAMWGIGLLSGTLIGLTIIFSLSVAVANGVNTVVSLASTALLMVATVVLAERARVKREHLGEQTTARQG